jgi:hypothetical protein
MRHHNHLLETVVTCGLLAVLSLAPSFAWSPAAGRAAQKAPNTYTIPLPPPTDYSRLQWLLGQWAGKTVGKGPQGEVMLSASYTLGKRFVMLREQVSLPATKTAPAVQEGSMGILSGPASGNLYDLAWYSSTGFVTRYQVSAGNDEIDFNPEGGIAPPAGWLFRRTIRHTGPDRCVERVDVAPPGQPFFSYYTATLSRLKPEAAPSRLPRPPR